MFVLCAFVFISTAAFDEIDVWWW